MTDDAPPFSLDIVHPEIVEGLVPVPASKEVDLAVVGIDAHGVSTTLRGGVPVGVDAVQTAPLGVGLTGLEVGLEEAGGGGLVEERLSFVPVALEHEGGVERCHDRMFEFNLRTGEDGLVGGQEPSFAEVLENVSEDDRFTMLTHVHRMGVADECETRNVVIGRTHLVVTESYTVYVRRLRDARHSDVPNRNMKALPVCPEPCSEQDGRRKHKRL